MLQTSGNLLGGGAARLLMGAEYLHSRDRWKYGKKAAGKGSLACLLHSMLQCT